MISVFSVNGAEKKIQVNLTCVCHPPRALPLHFSKKFFHPKNFISFQNQESFGGRMKRNNIQKIFYILVVVSFATGIIIGYGLNLKKAPAEKIIKEATKPATPTSLFFTSISVPAVDNEGNGMSVSLSVESRNGSGRVLTNIDKLLFWVDTQQSIQIAKQVAENITGVSASSLDIIYMIDTNATLVGGPSAGAALTIATVAVLRGEQPNKSVMITGTINPDSSVGAVGGILEKARAAKNVGVTLFLVPEGQGTETRLMPEEKCTERRNFIFCETKYKQMRIDISESAGLQVREVSNIAEAMKYFFESIG